MGMRDTKEYTILNAANDAVTGNALQVADFKNIILSFATDGGNDAALTVKFQGSIQETCPDFSASQATDNMWDYIEVIDLEDGAAIDGDTGVSVAAADDYRLLEANINGLMWFCATITSRTEGELTLKAMTFHE